MLLNILASGDAFWFLTGIFLLLEAIFLYQLIKGQKSGSRQQDLGKGTQYFKEPVKLTKNPFLWYSIVVLVLYISALLILNSDYKGVQ